MHVKDLHRHLAPFLLLLSWCVGGRELTGLKVLTSAEKKAHTQVHTHTHKDMHSNAHEVK